jgi:hypothetical protein
MAKTSEIHGAKDAVLIGIPIPVGGATLFQEIIERGDIH